MKYNFDKVIHRRGTNSYKWDSEHAAGLLPLWVADMDFETAPCVVEALEKRLEHHIFGYTIVPDSYYEAIASWFASRHGWSGITREETIYTIGVVPAISAILAGYAAHIGKKRPVVCTLTPTYNCFFSSIRNTDCILRESELLVSDDYYHIDWDDLENAMAECDLFLLCNPANPVGRVWTRDELQRIADLAAAHHVFVLSDEIHCEFAFSGHPYTPYATVSLTDEYAICTSASKAFNLAGLQCANIFCPNESVRARIDKQINIHEVCDLGTFGPVALEAAYREGGEWLNQLVAYIEANYRFLVTYFSEHMPALRVTKMEGTYLAWIECSALLHGMITTSSDLEQDIAKKEGVLFNAGEMYGHSGRTYLRINMACPRETLTDALSRLSHYAKASII